MATENDPSALLQYDPAAVAILADDEETLIKLKEFGKQLKRYAGMRIEMEHSKSKGEDEEEDITGEMGNGDERSQESTTVAAAARVTPSKSSTRRKRAPSITTPRKHKSVLPASVTSYGFNRPRKMARTSKKQATSSTQKKAAAKPTAWPEWNHLAKDKGYSLDKVVQQKTSGNRRQCLVKKCEKGEQHVSKPFCLTHGSDILGVKRKR